MSPIAHDCFFVICLVPMLDCTSQLPTDPRGLLLRHATGTLDLFAVGSRPPKRFCSFA